ncbi:ABC transporter permease [Yaniella flava]
MSRTIQGSVQQAQRVRQLPRANLWASFSALMRWQLLQVGTMLPLIVVVQGMLAAGIVVGFGFIIPDITDATALFLSTGAPAMLLLTIGLVLVPQAVARMRTDGTFEFMRSLPVPRLLMLAVELTVWSAIALPGVAIGILVAQLRYDLSLAIDWGVLIAAAVLVTVMATAIGYAIAVTLQPMLAQLISQVLVFFVMLFSPITFPASQLPEWFQILHDYLPIQAGADLLRAGLASQVYEAGARDVIVLFIWCVAGVAITLRALMRRK